MLPESIRNYSRIMRVPNNFGNVAQLVEHLSYTQGRVLITPRSWVRVPPFLLYAHVAQLIELWSCKPPVGGSNPPVSSNLTVSIHGSMV